MEVPKKLAILILAVISLVAISACSKPYTLDGPTEVISLYRAQCLNCHGAELQGRMGERSNLRQVGARLTKEEIIEQLQHGGSLMPGFADRLSQEQLEELSEWLAQKK